LGGIPNQPLGTSSFAGGTVLNWDVIIDGGFNSANVVNGPSKLPTSAFTRFNFAQAYINSDTT
jgi:hypothetical protein